MLRPRGGKRAGQGGRRNERGAKRRKPEPEVAEMQSTPGESRRRELLTPPGGVTAVDVGKLSTELARLIMVMQLGFFSNLISNCSLVNINHYNYNYYCH